MANYTATLRWTRDSGEVFTDNQYSRGHEWHFDGGTSIPASSSPHVVPIPLSVEANVDPEEAFVAAISSCHLLFFLSIAAKKRFVVDSYVDHPVGIMEKNEAGKMAMTKVTLYPVVTFSGDKQPDEAQLKKIHDLAHQQCYIANSVKTEVTIEI